MWDWELKGFLSAHLLARGAPALVSTRPYKPGRIPVVFVHGTASSPGALGGDGQRPDRTTPRCASLPVLVLLLRLGQPDRLLGLRCATRSRERWTRSTPTARDPALHDMVVIGHSQGGLLTKMTAVDTGDAFWDARQQQASRRARGFATRRASCCATRSSSSRCPSSPRVIFIATPHRGSYMAGQLAGSQPGRRLRRSAAGPGERSISPTSCTGNPGA